MATPQITPGTPANRPTAKPAVPASKPAVNNVKPVANFDDNFMRKAPSAEQLATARAAIKALDGMPGIPLSNKAKEAWLTQARELLAKAEAGEKLLGDAEFWTHSVPKEESDAARERVGKFRDQIQKCEERGGFKPTPAPLSPFRPLFQAQKGMLNSNNPLLAILGALTLPALIVVDMVDLVTRPIQLVLWPVAWAWHGVKAAGRGLGIG